MTRKNGSGPPRSGRVRAIPPRRGGNGRPRGIYAGRFNDLPVLGYFVAEAEGHNAALRAMATYWSRKLGRRFVTRLREGLVHVYREA